LGKKGPEKGLGNWKKRKKTKKGKGSLEAKTKEEIENLTAEWCALRAGGIPQVCKALHSFKAFPVRRNGSGFGEKRVAWEGGENFCAGLWEERRQIKGKTAGPPPP